MLMNYPTCTLNCKLYDGYGKNMTFVKMNQISDD